MASPGRLDKALLAAGFGPSLFVAVLLVESFTRRGYRPWSHFGSELANGERGWIVITAFITAGVLTVLFAVGLRRSLTRGRAALAGPILVGLFGLGLIVAGAFVVDPKPGYPAASGAPSTLAGAIHDANLFATWIVMTAAMIAMARRFAVEPGGKAWTWYTIAAAALALGALMTALALFDSQTQTGAWHGLWQRIAIVTGFTWFAATAIQRLRLTRPPAGSSTPDYKRPAKQRSKINGQTALPPGPRTQLESPRPRPFSISRIAFRASRSPCAASAST